MSSFTSIALDGFAGEGSLAGSRPGRSVLSALAAAAFLPLTDEKASRESYTATLVVRRSEISTSETKSLCGIIDDDAFDGLLGSSVYKRFAVHDWNTQFVPAHTTSRGLSVVGAKDPMRNANLTSLKTMSELGESMKIVRVISPLAEKSNT